MAQASEPQTYSPDPASIFAAALSLWQSCHKRATSDANLNLSECYNGMDQFMREVMRIATEFETWACLHIAFDETDEVWPYLLEAQFGEACLTVIPPGELSQFDETDCLRIALRLRLPIRPDDKLPLPCKVTASNPVPSSAFREFRIQTVRDSIEDNDSTPFTVDDNPFDPEFGPPYFGLYGAGADGLLEHIADRDTYSEAIDLAQKIAPGIAFVASAPVVLPEFLEG